MFRPPLPPCTHLYALVLTPPPPLGAYVINGRPPSLTMGKIITDLYCKPTDRNNYLPFNSAHPYHCKKGLPYGQFLRLRRICSRDEDFLTQSAKKAALLLQKQYPMELLINSHLKAQAKDRVDLLKPKETKVARKKRALFSSLRHTTRLTTAYPTR